MKIPSVLLAILLPALLSGCIVAVGGAEHFSDENDWKERAADNRRAINRLVVGQSLQSVIELMGQPDINEAFTRDGKTHKVYYYRTQRVHADSRTTKDEATPLLIVDGELVGWGEAALEHARVN